MADKREQKVVSNNTHRETLFGIGSDFLVCMFLGLITLAVYWQVIDHEFVIYDDSVYVTDNHHVQDELILRKTPWSFSFTDKKIYVLAFAYMAFSHLDVRHVGIRPLF